MREWRKRNRQLIREYMDVWRYFNGGRIASYNIAYSRAIKQQTPRWADMHAINAMYLRAKELGLTVDHVIPLRGEMVSGLHVANNMRLVPHAINASKGNKFEPQSASG
jgi:hypothetical protein